MDWKLSLIKKKLDKGEINFNQEGDPKYLKEDEIEYFINLMRYSPKDFSNIEILRPLFNKSLATLEKVMEELLLGPMFDRISVKIMDISLE